ncbi:response regulator transcription factor [Caldinitratiruptor microaerophilus]|uniref:Stage 0 sporulation protein A homolog n=1 Tax=Caldinitratiruptor microaerophilus TaxID=671077 RepID=A0AA35CJ46_9FIRM|nr:response regulator transcription factor [Caldinitratiruptor microaerophilus]BDG60224.1 DNA-binding response regulator [Caldinitratiruptor microaerophilus]
MSTRILVVDDERHIRELCRLYLEQEGFTVTEAGSGDEALDAVRRARPDLVILDLMLPGTPGLEVARALVERDVPTILLTARTDEVDRVLGLELGADDYVTKPFSPRELVARVKAVLRRVRRTERPGRRERLEFPDFVLDLAARTLTVRGKPVDCPPKEFDLLATLAQNPNRVFTRQQLLERVWDYSFYGDYRTVDVHVQRLRKKIEPEPDNPRYIRTVWGIGYRFEPDPDA